MPQVKFGNSNTKIVVLPPSAFEQRGYSANIHPEGYVYFTRNETNSREDEVDLGEGENAVAEYSNSEDHEEQKFSVSQETSTDNSIVQCAETNSEARFVQTDGCNYMSEMADSLNTMNNELYQTDIKNNADKRESGTTVHFEERDTFKDNEHKYFHDRFNINHKMLANEVNFTSKDSSQCDNQVKDHSTRYLNMNLDDGKESSSGNKVSFDNSSSEEKCSEHLTGPAITDCSKGDSDCQQFTRQIITFCFPSGNAKRKLHKSYASIWGEDISRQGYARCFIATCNFISLTVIDMQEHYKICDGKANYAMNCCLFCKSRLPSLKALQVHRHKCKDPGKSKIEAKATYSSNQQKNKKSTNIIKICEDWKLWKKQVEEQGHANCTRNGCKFTSNKLSVMAKHYDCCQGEIIPDYEPLQCRICKEIFATTDDCKEHEVLCNSQDTTSEGIATGKQLPLHIRDILKLRDGELVDFDRIVQDSPVFPKDQYRRRRGYTKQHKAIWKATLEKHKYVKCIYQNCYFLAMSLEDMICHFGYCDGDASFAKYVCPHCNGRVTSKNILEIHMQKSHPSQYEDYRNQHRAGHHLVAIHCSGQSMGSGLKEFPNKENNLSKTAEGNVECEESKVGLQYLYQTTVDDEEFNSALDVCEPGTSGIDAKIEIHAEDDNLVHFENAENKFKLKPLLATGETKSRRTIRTYHRNSNMARTNSKEDVDLIQTHFMQEERILNENSIVTEAQSVTFEETEAQNRMQEIIQGEQSDLSFQNAITNNETPEAAVIKAEILRNFNSEKGYNDQEAPEIDELNLGSQTQVLEAEVDVPNLILGSNNETNTNTAKTYETARFGTDTFTYGNQEERMETANENLRTNKTECIEQAIEANRLGHECAENLIQPEVHFQDNVEEAPEAEEVVEERICEPQVKLPPSESFEVSNLSKNEREDLGVMEDNESENMLVEEQMETELIHQFLEVNVEPAMSNDLAQNGTQSQQFEEEGEKNAEVKKKGRPKRQKRGDRKVDSVQISVGKDTDAEADISSTRRCRPRRSNIIHVRSEFKMANMNKGRKRSSPKQKEKTSVPDEDARPAKIKKTNNPVVVVSGQAKCAKCDFVSSKENFPNHNNKKHVGLSWMDGETAIDINDEANVLLILKRVFKSIKSASCESCGAVKKSAVGFFSHIQSCGKSEEEKQALKVECHICSSRVLKCSMPAHMKLSHPDPVPGAFESPSPKKSPEVWSKKRQSAIRAASKFQEVLRQTEGDVTEDVASYYVLYEKGNPKLPRIPAKIIGLWNKMKRDKRKIPCRRGSCLVESENVADARLHHFMCSELPENVFVCERCDYYSLLECKIQQHVELHIVRDKDYAHSSEAEELEGDTERRDEMELDELEESEEGDENDSRKRGKQPIVASEDAATELEYRKDFLVRENLWNRRGSSFIQQSLFMSFKEDAEKHGDNWPELTTKRCDWRKVAFERWNKYLPKSAESVPVHIALNSSKEFSWKRFSRLESDIIAKAPVMFTGGGVRSMSWCYISTKRMMLKNVRQYLAVGSSMEVEKLYNVYDRVNDSSLVQIWDAGVLDNNPATEPPRLALGIVLNSSEVNDLTWLPTDTYFEGSSDELNRLGLLTAACSDGHVRVWSVCDPCQLGDHSKMPLYDVDPAALLTLEENPTANCLLVAANKMGTIVAGFSSGVVAVWNLNNISSIFTKVMGRTRILKPHLSLQAHRTTITVLTICPFNDRFITTGGLDRCIRFWDLESPDHPVETYSKEVCLSSVWPQHWPLNMSTFEDVIRGPFKGSVKMIRDIFMDKHRSPLSVDGTCWSLSFSDWLNMVGYSNNNGDVKIKLLRNLLMPDEKSLYKAHAMISSTEIKRLKDIPREEAVTSKKTPNSSNGSDKSSKKRNPKVADLPKNYEEAKEHFGLVITDFATEEFAQSPGPTKFVISPDEFSLSAITKVCFNPNLRSFTHIAIGYRCGLIRILPLTALQKDKEVTRFLSDLP